MICLVCRATYDTIACPACAERRNREHLHAQQVPYLQQARAGSIDLNLGAHRYGLSHIALFNFPKRAFCGLSLESHHRSRIAYNNLLKHTVCAGCAAAICEVLKVESL